MQPRWSRIRGCGIRIGRSHARCSTEGDRSHGPCQRCLTQSRRRRGSLKRTQVMIGREKELRRRRWRRLPRSRAATDRNIGRYRIVCQDDGLTHRMKISCRGGHDDRRGQGHDHRLTARASRPVRPHEAE